jgi:hypothetical protein
LRSRNRDDEAGGTYCSESHQALLSALARA